MRKNSSIVSALAGISLLCFFLFSGGSLYAADTESWRILDQAKVSFDGGEFGEALKLCDKARDVHVSSLDKSLAVLDKSVMPAEVKKAGDDLHSVYEVLQKREDFDALSILDGIFLTHPAESFGNSFKTLRLWLVQSMVYPEADILSGKIYEAEGENDLALSFFEKAWQNRTFLDIPEERTQVAYYMAGIAYNAGKYGDMEKYLLLVLTEDALFGKPGEESSMLKSMYRIIDADTTMEKFFLLYRHANYTALKAYQDLASFYYDSGKRIDRALPVATIAACISVTQLEDAVSRADFQYTYTGFTDLLDHAGMNKKLADWAHENGIWNSFLLLASVLYDHGETVQSASILKDLAAHCPDSRIARRSSGLLTSKGL